MDPSSFTYPTKPLLPAAARPGIGKTLYSLLLFVGAFYLIFDSDLIYIFLIVLILLIHELGHYIAMRMYNYQDVRMFFVPLLGALVTGEKDKISQKQRSIILLAGPVPGIIIGTILYLWLDGDRSLFGGYGIMAANIFILLNIFNLLPVTPLDGGHLLETLFFGRHQGLQLVFMGLSAILLAGIAILTQSYFLLIIPFFLVLRLQHVRSTGEKQKIMEDRGIDYRKSFDELSDESYWKIREMVIEKGAPYQQMDPRDYQIHAMEGRLQEEIKGLLLNPPIPDLSLPGKLLMILIWLAAFFVPPLLVFGF